MGISRTFQTIRLFPSMTTWENVLIGQNFLSRSGIGGILPVRRPQELALRAQAEDALKVLGLWEMRDRKAVNLPYGSQRKVEIARAIAAQPKLLLLDEPTAGMNIRETKDLLDFLSKIHNPNSPTGWLYEKDDVLRVIRFAAEKNVLVFVDEDYIFLADDGIRYSMVEYVNEFNNLFVLRSLTKFYGLAGVRVGFGISSADIAKILKNVKMPWSVNSLAMVATEAAVRDTDFIKNSRLLVSKGRREMREMFKAIPWLKVYPSETNFLLVEIIKGDLTSTQVREELAKKGLLIRDCKDFDGLNNRFFRVTVRRPEENKKLIEQIKSFSNPK